jgi:hypothetical protein
LQNNLQLDDKKKFKERRELIRKPSKTPSIELDSCLNGLRRNKGNQSQAKKSKSMKPKQSHLKHEQ